MKQRVLTLVLPIRSDAGALADIRGALREIGDQVQSGNTQFFANSPHLHFLSCCVLDAKQEPPGPACLVVEFSIDGEAREFLRRLVGRKRQVLDQILASCDGYPGANADARDVVRYLEAGTIANRLVYLGTPGRSLSQIELERGLRGKLAGALRVTSGSAASRAERWREAVAAVQAQRPGLTPAPARPLRVRLNTTNPKFRARVRGALRLLAWVAFWLAGVGAAAQWAREPWHAVAVIGVPVAVAATSAALLLLNSPRRLTARARLSVGWLALREFAVSALWLVPLGGLVVAAFEMHWERVWIATALSWGISIALALLLVAIVAAFTLPLAGLRAAIASALVVAVIVAWRFQVSPSAGQLLGEIALALLAGIALIALLAGVYALALRRLEIRRTVWDRDEDLDQLALVTRREHGQYQSHLISETEVEAGSLRMRTLLAVLRSIDALAWYWFNLGHLAGIPSIHFARFLVLPERRSLIFLSNYDDRFDDYLGDFSSVWGVTAIWGNTELDSKGFPRPYLLFFDGARRENLFKRYARASQVESLIWYSAYPKLSVAEIDQATALRERMGDPIDDGRTGFLADLRRWWRPPLDEAALAALIEGL